MYFSDEKSFLSESHFDVEATDSGLTPDVAGAYRMIAESNEEWYNLDMKMMRLEHHSIVNEDANLLEAGTNDFFSRIGDGFLKMVSRLKEIWNNFVTWATKAVGTDKAFVQRYGKVLEGKNITGIEVKGHKWKSGNLGSGMKFGALLSQAQNFFNDVSKAKTPEDVKALREKIEDSKFLDEARALVAGHNGSVSEGDFAKVVRSSFIAGNIEGETLSASDIKINEFLKVVADANANIGSAKDEQRAVESLLQTSAKFYKELGNKVGSNSHAYAEKKTTGSGGHVVELGGSNLPSNHDDHKDSRTVVSNAAQVAAVGSRKLSTVATAGFGYLLSAIKERRSEYRSILAKAASFGNKSEKADKKDDKKEETKDGNVSESYTPGILDRY